MKKKSERKKLKEKLEKKVKKLVKLRDNYTCQFSGERVEGANCHASHVIPVSADGRLAYEPLNLKVLSYHQHINWWHKNPLKSGKWFAEKFPDRKIFLEDQHRENRTKGPITMDELHAREKELDKALEQYKEPENGPKLDDLKYL